MADQRTDRTATRQASHPPAPPGADHVRVDGSAVVYRLFDIGYEIHLDRALDLLATSAPERVRPVRGEGQAIQVKNPPVTVILGSESIVVGRWRVDAEVSARVFDFGVVSLRLRIPAPSRMPWREYVAFGNDLDVGVDLGPIFQQHLRVLADRIRPAIERPELAPVSEDYIVFRVTRLSGERGEKLGVQTLREDEIIPLLLNESRALSGAARRELLPHRFSYYSDDLAILTWDNALIADPSEGDTDIQYVLEFANAQLLELRYYDALLDAELPQMYDRVAALRRRRFPLISRRFAPLLADLQALVADCTELVERAENALKVTDDVYLARVYSAALEIFRGRAWRSGIDRKLAIIRETYEMLNAESQAARAEVLEMAIVVLIVADIVLALVRG
jgi:hypothetical protein